MSGWGWFILVIIILVPAAYAGYIFWKRQQAKKQGLPPPPFNPFAHREQGGSQIYPAPAGAIGWVKNKYYALRNSRTKTGAYEQTSADHRRGLDPDEAWDSRVGAEADGYGPGGYYEEQELGLRPPPPGSGRNDFSGGGYGEDGSLPSYGHQDMQRGRSLSRGEDTAYIGGGKSGLDRRYDEEMQGVGSKTKENPFGDAAEASSMRAVSPRPDGQGHKKGRSDGSNLKPDDSPIERRSAVNITRSSQPYLLTPNLRRGCLDASWDGSTTKCISFPQTYLLARSGTTAADQAYTHYGARHPARMFILPRTYQQARQQLREEGELGTLGPVKFVGWKVAPESVSLSKKMLLVHQTGSVKIGEVVRYTLRYTPSQDRILPPPSTLYIKIKNTSAIPLRAAYLHGPYTLYTACYPSTFDPNCTNESCSEHGAPEFEPNLKAGGSWMSKLTVPENIRESADKAPLQQPQPDEAPPSMTWIIEISSQIIFSTSAVVHFELQVSRDEKSLDVGFGSLAGQGHATPGQLEDHQQSKRSRDGHHSAAQPRGVYSHAVNLLVEDTVALWNKPAMPEWKDDKEGATKPGSRGLVNGAAIEGKVDLGDSKDEGKEEEKRPRKRRKVHLVVLTHGLHSNLGADMLYMKESIDAAAAQAKADRAERRATARQQKASRAAETTDSGAASDKKLSTSQGSAETTLDADDEDDEDVIVRGFADNACRTERGIQYLGKRLAKWILCMTYPDQPFLPAKKSVRKKIIRAFSGDLSNSGTGTPEHKNSSIYKPTGKKQETPAYKITSISFIAHSLGGLTQTYAIAYINKHSPHFFDDIRPINFVTLAAPFLGLSNENPLYVRFALDFGLVGRTGQDLGLTWKSSTALRGGWDSMIAGIGSEGQRAPKQPDPGSKPLLRILPTGHTHHVLKMFRNRTLYSNVVNDGIVPLRTSCLLFLDWSGLGRVEKARRDNGLVAGLAGWGWAELTGANASSRHLRPEQDSDAWSQSNVSGEGTPRSRSRNRGPLSRQVPRPEDQDLDEEASAEGPEKGRFLSDKHLKDDGSDLTKSQERPPQPQASPLAGFLSLFRPGQNDTHHPSPKQTKIYKRSQTVRLQPDGSSSPSTEDASSAGPSRRPSNVRGNSVLDDPESVVAPPRTTIFESAGDVLNPPLPSQEFLMSPRSRPRTIFHDRVYHPEDIPPPPAPPTKTQPKLKRSISSDLQNTKPPPSRASTIYDSVDPQQVDTSGMKVEEKIARAYHHGLSWRKVLVRLEPDAHNNMVVRRMFANAYGWPVVKHLVDTHFADTYEAVTADVNEPSAERAKDVDKPVGLDGEEVVHAHPQPRRTDSERAEEGDSVPEMKHPSPGFGNDGSRDGSLKAPASLSRNNSVLSTGGWDDTLFEGSDSEDEVDTPTNAKHHTHPLSQTHERASEDDHPSTEAEIQAFLSRKPVLDTTPGNGHRGEGGVLTQSPKSATSLGLGKSLEEQLGIARAGEMPKPRGERGDDGGNGEDNRKDGVKGGVEDISGEADGEEGKDLSEVMVENGH